MKRLALVTTVALTSATLRADPLPLPRPATPPPFMPAPPRAPTRGDQAQIRHLRHEAAAYGTIGLVLAAAGVAVNVVALDVPQGERTMRQPDGKTVTTRVRDDANWFELAGGLTLLATGIVLGVIALMRARQAARLQGNE